MQVLKLFINLNYSSTFKIKPEEIITRNFLKPQRSKKMQDSYDNLVRIESCPKVLCKNTILLLMHIKNYETNNGIDAYGRSTVSSVNLFFKKKKRKNFTLLRAPYRYKIARNQFSIKRFHFLCSIKFKIPNVGDRIKLGGSFSDVIIFNNLMYSLVRDLNTNICNQNNVSISLPYSNSNFFLIDNYKA